MRYRSEKYRFPIDPELNDGCTGERMWVKIDENGKAFLDNHPIRANLKFGDEIDLFDPNLEFIESGESYEEVESIKRDPLAALEWEKNSNIQIIGPEE